MSETSDRRMVVIVDDDHDYKAALQHNLNEFVVEFWGCRPEKCKICNADQPFSQAVDFIRGLNARTVERLVAIVLDVNEFHNDEYSIKEILPALRSDTELVDIPVIVYSAKYLQEQGRRAMREGAVYYYDRAAKTPKEAAEIIRKYALP